MFAEMWKNVKREEAKAKEKANDELYEKLNTKKGERHLVRLVKLPV